MMRSLRLPAALLGSILVLAGCGAAHETAGHEAAATTPAPPPTPDTTPVPALRTPAGIGLKPDVVTPPPAAK